MLCGFCNWDLSIGNQWARTRCVSLGWATTQAIVQIEMLNGCAFGLLTKHVWNCSISLVYFRNGTAPFCFVFEEGLAAKGTKLGWIFENLWKGFARSGKIHPKIHRRFYNFVCAGWVHGAGASDVKESRRKVVLGRILKESPTVIGKFHKESPRNVRRIIYWIGRVL